MKNTLTPIENDYPLERALCTFRTKDNLLFVGYTYTDYNLKKTVVKRWGAEEYFDIKDMDEYQYILQQKGGNLFAQYKYLNRERKDHLNEPQ